MGYQSYLSSVIYVWVFIYLFIFYVPEKIALLEPGVNESRTVLVIVTKIESPYWATFFQPELKLLACYKLFFGLISLEVGLTTKLLIPCAKPIIRHIILSLSNLPKNCDQAPVLA